MLSIPVLEKFQDLEVDQLKKNGGVHIQNVVDAVKLKEELTEIIKKETEYFFAQNMKLLNLSESMDSTSELPWRRLLGNYKMKSISIQRAINYTEKNSQIQRIFRDVASFAKLYFNQEKVYFTR